MEGVLGKRCHFWQNGHFEKIHLKSGVVGEFSHKNTLETPGNRGGWPGASESYCISIHMYAFNILVITRNQGGSFWGVVDL